MGYIFRKCIDRMKRYVGDVVNPRFKEKHQNSWPNEPQYTSETGSQCLRNGPPVANTSVLLPFQHQAFI